MICKFSTLSSNRNLFDISKFTNNYKFSKLTLKLVKTVKVIEFVKDCCKLKWVWDLLLGRLKVILREYLNNFYLFGTTIIQ